MLLCIILFQGKELTKSDYKSSEEGAKGVFARAAAGDSIAQGIVDKVSDVPFSTLKCTTSIYFIYP